MYNFRSKLDQIDYQKSNKTVNSGNQEYFGFDDFSP